MCKMWDLVIARLVKNIFHWCFSYYLRKKPGERSYVLFLYLCGR